MEDRKRRSDALYKRKREERNTAKEWGEQGFF